jgi:hypothetical protein
MEKSSYRSYIQMRLKLGIRVKQVNQKLKIENEDTPITQTVHNW